MEKPKAGLDDDTIHIVPEAANFKSELEEGSSEIASNDTKFEMNFDFRDFVRKDVQITITKTMIKIVANSETEFETTEFDEDIEIPPRVLRETIACRMNKKGVLRISAPLQPDTQEVTSRTTAERVTTIKKTVEESAKTIIKQDDSQEQVVEEDDGKSKSVAKKIEEKFVVKQEKKKIDKDGNIVLKPLKANFTIDAKLVTPTPEFKKPEVKVGNITPLLAAYLKCTQYTSEEIAIKISRSIIRIEGRHNSITDTRSFVKEINIPKGVKRENIECDMNENGILRITAEETSSTEILDPVESKSDDPVIMTPKKINFDCPPQEDISVAKQLNFSRLNEKTVQMFANVSQYSSEEVLIRRTKRIIQMEGKHESKAETREFYKEIAIPGDVDGDSVDCAINEKGIVRFTATKTKTTTKTIIRPKIMESSSTSNIITTNTSESCSSGPIPIIGNFEFNVVAQGYLPDEINISISNGWITITGKKEGKVFGGESSFRTRSFTKKIQIPPHINPESILCSLDDNTGSLSITTK